MEERSKYIKKNEAQCVSLCYYMSVSNVGSRWRTEETDRWLSLREEEYNGIVKQEWILEPKTQV